MHTFSKPRTESEEGEKREQSKEVNDQVECVNLLTVFFDQEAQSCESNHGASPPENHQFVAKNVFRPTQRFTLFFQSRAWPCSVGHPSICKVFLYQSI